MTDIRTINKLSFILQLKKSYILDLACRADSCFHPYDKTTIKADGATKVRRIDNPNTELKVVQEKINDRILRPCMTLLPDYIHGARPSKSIVTNAAVHVGKEGLLSLDIKKCFPSIKAHRVYHVFRNELRYSHEVSLILTKLTTRDGSLPQGCPTSASLCNLVLSHMLGKLAKLSEDHNLDMSHYIDDIFFSGNCKDLYSIKPFALAEIGKNGFRPNSKKTHIADRSSQMRVTGVIINTKTSVGKARIHKIEREILKLKTSDKEEYINIKQLRKRQQRLIRKRKIKSCTIERLLGEISNVISINKQQGYRLKRKFNKKLESL